jgi:hypothetical protein
MSAASARQWAQAFGTPGAGNASQEREGTSLAGTAAGGVATPRDEIGNAAMMPQITAPLAANLARDRRRCLVKRGSAPVKTCRFNRNLQIAESSF